MIDIIFLGQADLDVQTAFERCEAYQIGRGELFIKQLDVALTLLRTFPEMAPTYTGAYRRLLLRHFPFAIFYQAQPRRIIVAAIIDLREDPKTWQRRLSN